MDNFKIDLKIFKIDKTYYEFRDKSFDEMIMIIKDNYIKKLRHKSKDGEIKEPKITEYEEEDFKFWFYCYNQIQEKFYWKIFLPTQLTEEQDFEILEFSYVLFIEYKDDLYCVIGGSGMSVIKKFIHPSYGIEIYQRIADITSDNIIELNTRSIANNISSKKETFNFNQTISETLDYSHIPTKIKLKVRKELKDGLFKKYNLDSNLAIMEVGSYIHLRKRIVFSELKELIIDCHNIYQNNPPKKLTLFTKINDEELVKNLDNYLLELIINDVLRHENSQSAKKLQNDIIEIVHPTKLETFYECNKFLIRYKHSKGKKDIEVFDRNDLYFITTKYIYDNISNINNRFEIKNDIYKLNIRGFIDDRPKTYGNLFSHITAEVEFEQNKYFKIDGHWYILENQFLSIMNEDAKSYYTKYCLKESFLNTWDNSYNNEDEYNKSYNPLDNYFVLDKIISENIESSVQLDGSHTRSRLGGQSVGFQARKMAKTTNSIFFSDNLGQILAFGSPKSGNHHDLNDIGTILEEILTLLEEVKIDHKGQFLNADAGFDSKKFREILHQKEIMANIPKNPRNGENFDDDFFIFDEELYKNRFKIERSFA